MNISYKKLTYNYYHEILYNYSLPNISINKDNLTRHLDVSLEHSLQPSQFTVHPTAIYSTPPSISGVWDPIYGVPGHLFGSYQVL